MLAVDHELVRRPAADMTTLEKLIRANRWRIKTGAMASTEVDGWNGAFLVPSEGELWHVIISDQMGFRHLSVSNAQKKMLPPWNVLCRLKEAFWADDAWVVLYIPAKNDYVNDHPYVHHLWEPLNEELPKPSIVLV
jgi:hypothetical protein